MTRQRSHRPLILSLGLCAATAAAAALIPWAAEAATQQDIDAGLATCTTDSLGYCTVPHGLGRTPAAVLATVSTPNSGPRIASQIDTDQFTAGTFRVRVGTPTGDAFTAGTVVFSYAAFAGVVPLPTSTPSPLPSSPASPMPSPTKPNASSSASPKPPSPGSGGGVPSTYT